MPINDRPTITAPDDDPYLWLEDVEGPRALDFVAQQSRRTLERFGGADFERDRDTLAAIFLGDIEMWNDTEGEPPRRLYAFPSRESLQYRRFQLRERQPRATVAPGPGIMVIHTNGTVP